MTIFKVIPKLWPLGIFESAAVISADDGRSYEWHGFRNLSFSIQRDDVPVVSGRPSGKKEIELVGPEGPLGMIRRGRMLTPSGKLLFNGESYRLPNLLHPSLPGLGIRFSRLGTTGLRTHWVEVSDESNEHLALGLLGYLHARSVFVED
jgi:hypothetical protein